MSTQPADALPILVGVDGSKLGRAALMWAAAEAARRGTPLHVVHVFVHMRTAGGQPVMDPAAPERVGGEVVREAVRAVRAEHPDLMVTSEVLLGGIANEMVRASEQASLVVIGARGHGRFTGMLIGSVSQQLAMHARCPVVIVRDEGSDEPRPVVVGVDGSKDAARAMRFAARYALGTGVPLRAVRSEYVEAGRRAATTDWYLHMFEDAQRVTEEVRLDLAELQREHPELELELLVDARHPVRAILDESEDAGLIVLGSRGLGGFTGLLLGSVSQGVLSKAPVSVAVIPAPEGSEKGA